MRSILVTIITLSVLFVFSCGPGSINKEEVDSWLVTISGDGQPTVDITGTWRDAKGNPVFGWGEGYIKQDGKKVEGSMGNYNIKGSVSEKKAYLVFLSGGYVYYTARLELMENNQLMGNYFDPYDRNQENGYPISFEKVKK